MTPFDYLNSITFNKEYMFDRDLAAKEYNAFMVNRGLSYYHDTIFHANVMNMNGHLDPKLQYDYLYGAISKKKRFSKWAKPVEDTKIDAIVQVYECSYRKALDILCLLTDEQIQTILKIVDTGGVKKLKS